MSDKVKWIILISRLMLLPCQAGAHHHAYISSVHQDFIPIS